MLSQQGHDGCTHKTQRSLARRRSLACRAYTSVGKQTEVLACVSLLFCLNQAMVLRCSCTVWRHALEAHRPICGKLIWFIAHVPQQRTLIHLHSSSDLQPCEAYCSGATRVMWCEDRSAAHTT